MSIDNTTLNFKILFYVDFSSKYGLTYLLSNGCFGCFFNDKTNLCVNPVTKLFTSVYLRKYYYVNLNKEDFSYKEIQTFKLGEQPEDLKKKTGIMSQFISFIKNETEKINECKKTQDEESSRVYLKRWTKLEKAVIFHLSNKILQVHFANNNSVLLFRQINSDYNSSGQRNQLHRQIWRSQEFQVYRSKFGK